jgi:hypothetical protein
VHRGFIITVVIQKMKKTRKDMKKLPEIVAEGERVTYHII